MLVKVTALYLFTFLVSSRKYLWLYNFSWKIKLLFKQKTTLLHIDRVVPPSFIRKLKDTNATLGASVVLECRVSGSAPISIGWFQDGNEIVSGPKCQSSFSENVCTLNLSLLEASDAGTYTCVAANVAGSEECSAVLTVQGQCARTRLPFLKSLQHDLVPALHGISLFHLHLLVLALFSFLKIIILCFSSPFIPSIHSCTSIHPLPLQSPHCCLSP